MSMTREETISILEESKRQNEIMRDNPSTFWASHQMAEGVKNAKRRIEAFEIALSALRPVRREQVEKVWRGEWNYSHKTKIDGFDVVQCSKCGQEALTLALYVKNGNFCPYCGAPMTDEAVQMVMERMEKLKNADTNY